MFGNNIYNDWGFTESPFSTKPLHSNNLGEQLLVGRDVEINDLAIRLVSADSAACLDGPVGAGKTSLANVTIFKGLQNYIANGAPAPLLIPCKRTFQIKDEQTAEDFKFEILMEVAQALIDNAQKFRYGIKIDGCVELNAWLNSPLLSQWGIGIGSLFSVNDGNQTNDSSGFSRSGFEKLLTGWLSNIFPEGRNGGVVCVIDNLELLEKSSEARKKIENLRDTLFTIRGIKWILCGAHGILQGVVTSPRLAGYLQEPMSVNPLKLSDAGAVINQRIKVLAIPDGQTPYLPLTPEDFHSLYTLLHQSLRTTLSYVEDYCMFISSRKLRPETAAEKQSLLFSWLKDRAKGIYDGLKPHAGQTTMNFFYTASSNPNIGGEFSPGDFEVFNFATIQAMRPHVKTLEDCGLLSTQKDDLDQRRKTISVTGKGWLIHWYKVTHLGT